MSERYSHINDSYKSPKRSQDRLTAESIFKLKRISLEETNELVMLMREKEKACKYKVAIKIRNKIIEGNLRLVLKFAGGYVKRHNKELSDLVSVGGIGLMQLLNYMILKKGFLSALIQPIG